MTGSAALVGVEPQNIKRREASMNSLNLIMKMMEGPKTTVEQVHLSTVMHLKMNPNGVLNLGCRMNRSTGNPINFGSFL